MLTIFVVLEFAAATSNAQQGPGSPPPATVFESSQSQVTLLELFTSEGCSSCPPAEAWLNKFKSNPELWNRVVPVAFHVDYWNRLGWHDRFSRPEFTERQRHYAAAWQSESLYTPSFVVNGREWRDWDRAILTASTAKVGKVQVSLTNQTELAATFEPENSSLQHLQLNVALLGAHLESDVRRGENSGRKLRHDFVALQFAKIEMVSEGNRWTGSVSFPNKSEEKPGAIAAWITTDAERPIQTTGGWLTPAK
ncbi:MAG: DUF1223 domain-containing protein [Verrucomicrobia bacterium]|nr:MAG: DUF1223 domain-containing protein [Verrucomicrobiota bacterium]